MQARLLPFAAACALGLLAGCASSPAPRAPATATGGPGTVSQPQIVPSRDGSFTGEIIGQPGAGSRFAGLRIGMDMTEVQQILDRAPDRWHTYESGKRWIPFYFGNDARRIQALYAGEGCLIFTGGNIWGSAGGDLIQIHHDPSGACYQP